MSSPFDYFKYKENNLSVEGLSLEEIANQTGTPVYVYSKEAFLKPLKKLQKGLKGLDHLICFAVKAYSNIAVLKLLNQAGAGMDLVSGGELLRALKAGVDPKAIVFSGVGKTAGEIIEALEQGIFSFNVESVAELAMISAIAEHAGKKAPVALRFNPDVDAKTHPYISTGLKKNKFGIQKAEILRLARNIGSFGGIELKGISIHIGSQLLSLSPLDDAFVKTRNLVEELNAILPQPLAFVDLGGGLGINYSREKAPTIKRYTDLIQRRFGPKSKMKHPLKILIEPGRTIAGNAGVLLTEVIYKKDRGKKQFLIVDAGMNDLLRPALYGSYHEIVPADQSLSRGPKKSTDVVGPVCESSDCFASDRALSGKIGSGDLLAILSAGAYGFSMANNYNTRPRPPEVLVSGDRFEIIRDREQYDDLFRGEHY